MNIAPAMPQFDSSKVFQPTNLNTPSPDVNPMDPADRALIQSFMEKYPSGGAKYTDEDKIKMLELCKKYGIDTRVLTGQMPKPTAAQIRAYQRIEYKNRSRGTPFVNKHPKKSSRAALRKADAKARKEENRAAHR